MKSEKEKMLAGEYYDAQDEELVRERKFARELSFRFNHTRPSERYKLKKCLESLLKVKGSFHIEAPFNFDYGYNIQLGNNFYANYGCIILDVNQVRIGENVLLGPSVQIYTAAHPSDPIERLTGKEYGKAIEIGNNTWIGGGTIICPGVKIGDNVTIGAGSVVTKDIKSNLVAAGNPCRIIRNI